MSSTGKNCGESDELIALIKWKFRSNYNFHEANLEVFAGPSASLGTMIYFLGDFAELRLKQQLQ